MMNFPLSSPSKCLLSLLAAPFPRLFCSSSSPSSQHPLNSFYPLGTAMQAADARPLFLFPPTFSRFPFLPRSPVHHFHDGLILGTFLPHRSLCLLPTLHPHCPPLSFRFFSPASPPTPTSPAVLSDSPFLPRIGNTFYF